MIFTGSKSHHGFFFTENGKLFAWGLNSSGQLALGYKGNQSLPVQVTFFDQRKINIKNIHVGLTFSVFKDEKNEYWGVGSNKLGQLGIRENVHHQLLPQKIRFEDLTHRKMNMNKADCGLNFIVYINDKGVPYSVGDNEHGQLGIGNKDLKYVVNRMNVPPLEIFTEIVCGSSHCILLSSSKKVFGCGRNDDGQLGVGNTVSQTEPVEVKALREVNVESIICGSYHTMFLTTDGDIYSCGRNGSNQLGFSHAGAKKVTVPTRVKPPNESLVAYKLICGGFFTLMFFKDKVETNYSLGAKRKPVEFDLDSIYNCGQSSFGELGIDRKDIVKRITKAEECYQKIMEGEKDLEIMNITVGNNQQFVVTRNSVYSCGRGDYGSLMNGKESKYNYSLEKVQEIFIKKKPVILVEESIDLDREERVLYLSENNDNFFDFHVEMEDMTISKGETKEEVTVKNSFKISKCILFDEVESLKNIVCDREKKCLKLRSYDFPLDITPAVKDLIVFFLFGQNSNSFNKSFNEPFKQLQNFYKMYKFFFLLGMYKCSKIVLQIISHSNFDLRALINIFKVSLRELDKEIYQERATINIEDDVDEEIEEKNENKDQKITFRNQFNTNVFNILKDRLAEIRNNRDLKKRLERLNLITDLEDNYEIKEVVFPVSSSSSSSSTVTETKTQNTTNTMARKITESVSPNQGEIKKKREEDDEEDDDDDNEIYENAIFEFGNSEDEGEDDFVGTRTSNKYKYKKFEFQLSDSISELYYWRLGKLFNVRSESYNMEITCKNGGKCLCHKEVVVVESDYFYKVIKFKGAETQHIEDKGELIIDRLYKKEVELLLSLIYNRNWSVRRFERECMTIDSKSGCLEELLRILIELIPYSDEKISEKLGKIINFISSSFLSCGEFLNLFKTKLWKYFDKDQMLELTNDLHEMFLNEWGSVDKQISKRRLLSIVENQKVMQKMREERKNEFAMLFDNLKNQFETQFGLFEEQIEKVETRNQNSLNKMNERVNNLDDLVRTLMDNLPEEVKLKVDQKAKGLKRKRETDEKKEEEMESNENEDKIKKRKVGE